MRLILSLVVCISLVSCATTELADVERKNKDNERQFIVKVSNVSGHIQAIGMYDYQDKTKLLGLSSKALYEKSQIQNLAIGETYTFETEKKGIAITYNYKVEGKTFGKRARWRPGKNRKVLLEYEFRSKEEGALIQTTEK